VAHGHGNGRGHGHDEDELPTGVAMRIELPNASLAADWDRMILPDEVKSRLVNWAVLSLSHGERLSYGDSGLQRLVLLAGPPGTGKSTTGRGLASAAIQQLGSGTGGIFVEVDPHALPSDMLGQSQRNVARFMQQTIPGIAEDGRPLIVLIDEIEAFALSRTAASFDTNPADLHRATDAVLAGLDLVAREFPWVLLVATTNFVEAVDEAVLSRVDWVVPFELPTLEVAMKIVGDALRRLSVHWPPLADLAEDQDGLRAAVARCGSLDGRTLAKLVSLALTLRAEVARDPGQLHAQDLEAAASILAGDGRAAV